MQFNQPLTPALSPSDGERVKLAAASDWSRFGDSFDAGRDLSLSPSEGERVGVRGAFDCIVAANAKKNLIGWN